MDAYLTTRQVAMVTRAAASDYDDWENEHQNPGWGSAKLISLLKKVSYRPLLGVGIFTLKLSLSGRNLRSPGRSQDPWDLWTH